MKYIFIGKQKIILCPKLKENQKETATSTLMGIWNCDFINKKYDFKLNRRKKLV